MESPLPSRHSRQLGAVRIDRVPVELAAADVDVDVARAQPALTLPREPHEPEEDDDGEGEVRLEEALGVVVASTRWADGDVELFLFAMVSWCSSGMTGDFFSGNCGAERWKLQSSNHNIPEQSTQARPAPGRASYHKHPQ